LENKKIRIEIVTILLITLTLSSLLVLPTISAGSVKIQRMQGRPHVLQATNTASVGGKLSDTLLKGPFRVSPLLVKPSLTNLPFNLPTHSKPQHGLGYKPVPAGAKPQFGFSPSTVICQPISAGCDAITLAPSGAVTSQSVGVLGLNSLDSAGLYGVDIEPPDQTLCAGNGYVMEVLNLGELRVFHTDFTAGSADIPLDGLMGLTTMTPTQGHGTGWSSGGDISCLYDYDNGGHWFITEFVSTTSESIGGTFAGCFATPAVFDTCREGIAVSVSNDPLGAYNVYFLDPNAVNPTDPGAGFLLNDFAKIATTRDAFLLFYDEFPLTGFGFGEFFNGAQELAFRKQALELGWPASTPFLGPTPNPNFNVVAENMGTDPGIQPPDGNGSGCTGNDPVWGPGVNCWYQVIPAQSPDPTQYDNSFGGTGYMLANLDFVSFAFGIQVGDNRIAEFQWTGLSNLNSYNCGACGGISFGGTLFFGVQPYVLNQGPPWAIAPQKAGPTPYGDLTNPITDNVGSSCSPPLPPAFCSGSAKGAVYANKVVASFGGTLLSVGVNMAAFPKGTSIRTAIYSDHLGKPSTLLGQSAVFTCATLPSCAGFNDLPINGVTLTTGTSYWLAFQTSSTTQAVVFKSSGTSFHVNQAFGFFPTSPTWISGPSVTFNLRMMHLPNPEGGIQANGDGFTQVSYANRQLWGGISTLINQHYPSPASDEVHIGSAYWVIGTASFDAGGTPTLTDQAYVSAKHEDLVFPAMASGGTTLQDGGRGAIITFTLTGNGGPTAADGGGFYPSTAYGRVSIASHGLIFNRINVVDLGQSPQDGFTEYQFIAAYGGPRPRWGDYAWAIFYPFSDGRIYFATEYIQSPNCSDSQFLNDPTCGGTRSVNANWGSSLNYVVP
jgi:hypothetical protein